MECCEWIQNHHEVAYILLIPFAEHSYGNFGNLGSSVDYAIS